MAAIKSIQFLPEIFRTDTNRKFLNATIDQLISEPNLKKINGYIGRKLAPSFKNSDSYIEENTADRQQYQLEPSLIIKNQSTDEIDFASTYTDLINKIEYYGGISKNHTRLFDNEYYSYHPRIDLDKFINFSQYYWLENGPDAVQISASGVPLEYTFNVLYDSVIQAYKFTGYSDNPNPTITLARGGIYTFKINEPNNNFFIQSRPGVDGVDANLPNINVRNVLGVENNGADIGDVIFRVPSSSAQAAWTSMQFAGKVDYATNLAYRDVQGASLEEINALGGLDGITYSLENKQIIFVNNNLSDELYWTDTPVRVSGGIVYIENYDITNYDENNSVFDPAEIIPFGERNDIYQIAMIPDEFGTMRVVLTPVINIVNETKIGIKSGQNNASKEFYSRNGLLNEIPLITAPLDTLFYQSGLSDYAVGGFKVIDPAQAVIDPDTEIVGRSNYVSPTGVVFTNGLKVIFDNTATTKYANKTYYVEGVGAAIKLVEVAKLTAAELNNDVSTPDYITINRASIDQNAWSRTNRWFHGDVIEKTAGYNNTDINLNQTLRAQRPIIEFEADLQLYNFGAEAKNPISVLDDKVTNAYTQIQGVVCSRTDYHDFNIDGSTVRLYSGTRVVFSVDDNNDVRDKIFNFSIEQMEESPTVYKAYIELAEDAEVDKGHTLIVETGTNGQKQWHYNGTSWILSQQKSAVNQEPKFDIINNLGVSFSDPATYPSTTFTGTKLFSYKRGTGSTDSILGFPLSYKNFISQGDIQFENNFDLESFTYLVGGVPESIRSNSGLLQKNISRDTSQRINIWSINQNFSRQYQIYDYIYDGSTNLFPIDFAYDPITTIPNIRVVVNSVLLDNTRFTLVKANAKLAVLIDVNVLTEGSSVFISIFNSRETSNNAYYEVPYNLDINSLNTNLTTLTLGQMRNHLITLRNNSLDAIGAVPGNSNIRDISYMNKGGSVLQHSAPVIYSGLFLNHPTMNYVDSITLAAREYSKFKIKFLELAANLELNRSDIAGSVDTIIKSINAVKNESFPWHYSDMVPFGDANKVVLPAYTVIDPDIKTFEITRIFNDTELSNRAVFAYLTRTINGVTSTSLLIKGRDYTFNLNRAALTLQNNFNLLYDDVITIVEYNNTDGSYVPETPTKMGLYPKFEPTKFLDNTYTEPTNVIQGHDGSLTPAFNDYRDDLLLELERRIYNNIKVNYDVTLFNINDYLPGKWRLTDYSRTEVDRILSQSFLAWVGTNKVDFSTNTIFESSDPFTWNYKKFRDVVTGENLPGSWRAIYKYFFDTDRPHTHPWEMLGFSEKPDYWDNRYGPAPYTGGNAILWSDLEAGYIHAGDRVGIDRRYARPPQFDQNGNRIAPGLVDLIPVDEAGNLRSPEEFLVSDFNSIDANLSFAVGDIGPVELAWRRSSDFPYALQKALALMKPAKYFALLVDTTAYKRNLITAQFVTESTGQHLLPTAIHINGYIDLAGTIERSSGYLNWIRDYIQNIGINESGKLIKDNLASLSVQLSYKVGGYTDKKFIKLLAEQSSPSSINDSVVIPEENYRLELYKGAPLKKITYSAVIVQKTENGYSVNGYDTLQPYFYIIPSVANNNSYVIDVSGTRGVIYRDFKKVKSIVPYGFEFRTRQQVVDFLVGYQRYLQSQGFVFSDRDADLDDQKDWILSAKEFMHWTTQGWKSGNIIILSPVSTTLKVYDTSSVVDEIKNTPYSSRVLDINSKAIRKNNFTIVRESNLFEFKSLSDQSIGLAVLDLVQIEHLLILDNQTVFQDVIYVPELGNRQYRLKLVGAKTANWNGGLELPGYLYSSDKVDAWEPGIDYLKGTIVSHKGRFYTALDKVAAAEQFQPSLWKQISDSTLKSGMIKNLAANAGQFIDFYDIDNQPIDDNLQLFSNGLIGFRDRSYFTNLGISPATQSKFYQGVIKQKGTNNAILALKGANFSNLNTSIDFFEEWAIRVGEYGATDINQYVEIVLPDTEFNINPGTLVIDDQSYDGANDIINVQSQTFFKSSNNLNNPLFKTETIQEPSTFKTLPYAGFVHVDDVDATIFNFQDSALQNIIDQVGVGYKIWIAKNHNNDWDVLRATQVPGQAFALRYNLDNTAEVIISSFHGLQQGDMIILKNFDPRFNGLYEVDELIDLTRFYIQINNNLQDLIDEEAVFGEGLVFKLTSARLSYASDVQNITPADGWVTNDKIWVDSIDEENSWAVYNKTDPWTYVTSLELPAGQYIGYDHFGKATNISPDGLTLYGGAPDSDSGRVAFYARDNNNNWNINGFLWANNNLLSGFGKTIVNGNGYLLVAAPNSDSGKGVVYFYLNQTLMQILANPTGSANDLFGESMAISDDGRYVYIGCPGDNKVFCYAISPARDSNVQNITGDGVNDTFALSLPATNPTEIIVTSPLSSSEYLPYIDYTISGSNIVFTTIPVNGIAIAITRRSSYYTLIETLPLGAEVPANSNFGCTIKCNSDGSVLVVGANAQSVDSVANTGAVYVYHRTINEFVADGISSTFTAKDNLNTINFVKLDNDTLLNGTDYYVVGTASIQFPPAGVPAKGKLIVAETNQFILDQVIYPEVKTIKGDKFGSLLAICNTSCNIYVTSSEYNETNYSFGIVSRFVNVPRVFGTITGSVINPTVTPGDYLLINGKVVNFTGSSLASVISNINGANIPGVTASNVGNKIRISSTVTTPQNKLDIKPGSGGTSIADLGLSIYSFVQVLKHPEGKGENFGSSIAVDQSKGILAVGSIGADMAIPLSFDDTLATATTFDKTSTKFVDSIKDSGAVYIFNIMVNPFETADNPSVFAYTQKLIGPNLSTNEDFGTSVDINNEFIVVGVARDNSEVNEGGSLYVYYNQNAKSGWTLIRNKEPRVDIETVSSSFIYNSSSQQILEFFDYLDPVKGKILGVVDQELDYKEDYDPASYNRATSSNVIKNTSFYWADRHVAKTWWDLSTISFIDYEQDILEYRIKNWGRTFPGSTVDIYEWVESNFLPSQYAINGGDGVPKYPDDSAYSSVAIVDPVTGIITQKYYYWVKGKTSVDVNKAKRRLSTSVLESYIENPKDQGIPYITFNAPNSVSVYNISNRLSGNDVVLHINLSSNRNQNLIHNEWQLVKQGTDSLSIPLRVINKLKDSLVGQDSYGRIVPDPSLALQNKFGILTTPRQSLFVDRLKALESYVNSSNAFFKQNPILLVSNPSLLYSEEPVPTVGIDAQTESAAELAYLNTDAFADGYQVLIPNNSLYDGRWSIYRFNGATRAFDLARLQSYKTTLFWTAIDWYDSSYIEGKIIDFTVDIYADIQRLELGVGDYIKVNDNGEGKWFIYEVLSDFSLNLIAAQDATVQLSSQIYDVGVGAGFDTVVFDSVAFDPQAVIEIQKIFDSIYSEILTNNLSVQFNQLFFTVINNVFVEQKSPDWIFKTSFIDVNHRLRALEQIPNYVKDDQNFYKDYIDEVKPYRSILREYVPTYSKVDTALGQISDFDNPAIYDKNLSVFRSPDIDDPADQSYFDLNTYQDYANNYKFKITELTLGNVGINYTIAPKIEITGGGGSGANATATINLATGEISSIVINNPGSGYTTTPNVFINGVGSGATAYPVLKNEFFRENPSLSYNTIRSIETKLKFDRVAYRTTVSQWKANAAYSTAIIRDGNTNAWQVDNLKFKSNLSLSSLVGDGVPQEIFFKSDGSKMYILGSGTDTVTELNLTTPWNISTASNVGFVTVAGQDVTPTGLYFRPDGTKMYIVGSSTDRIYEFTLGNAWQVNSASNVAAYSVSSQDATPTGIDFHPEGTSVYVIGSGGNQVYEYALNSPWQINTAAYTNRSFTISSIDSAGQSLRFKPDGHSLYIVGSSSDKIHQITLNDSWNLNSAYLTSSTSFALYEDTPRGLFIRSNGKELYVVGSTKDLVQQFEFDDSSIVATSSNLWLTAGNIVYFNNEAFLAANANISPIAWTPFQTLSSIPVNSFISIDNQWYTTTGNVYANSAAYINSANINPNQFDYTRYTRLDSGNVLLNAVDRIESYYDPLSGMPGKDPTQLMAGLEYPGIRVYGPEFRANAFEVTSNVVSFNYTGLTINSGNVAQLDFESLGFQIDQPVRVEALVPFDFKNNGYFRIVNVDNNYMTLTGAPIETTYKVLLSTPITANTGDYITQTNSVANAFVLSSVSNSRYVDIIYQTPAFTISANSISINGIGTLANVQEVTIGGNVETKLTYLDLQTVLDSNIYSTYSDTALGTRPEDINIVGGDYVDIYNSHAPEELIPARMYDALEMRVFSNATGNTTTYGFRVFQPMSGNAVYTRISANSTTTLSANLSLNDNFIYVSDASRLPQPNPEAGVPGIVFINGEKITYYKLYDDARIATATGWTANTSFAIGSLVGVFGNVYEIVGNIYANSNAYINTANLSQVYANTISQLRRGVDGTGAPTLHLANTRVVDSSIQQNVLYSNDFSYANIAGNVTPTANLSWRLTLSANITANIGDYITQFVGNIGNVRVLGNVVSTNIVPVEFVSGNLQFAANTGTRVNVIVRSFGNVTTTNANVISLAPLGQIYSNSNVYLSGVNVLRSNLWVPLSTGVGLEGSTIAGAVFIREEPSYIP